MIFGPSGLHTKLRREIWQMRGQLLAIALVIAGGIAVCLMSLVNYSSLTATRDQYYQEHQFADVFVSVKRAPRHVLQTVSELPGVTRLSGVNVIARNIADPMLDSVSTFSGAYTNSTSQADPNVGVFELNNLTPGAEYVLFVDEVTAATRRMFDRLVVRMPSEPDGSRAVNA